MTGNDPFEHIIKFLLDPYNENNKTGFDILYKIFLKEFNKFDILKKYDFPEDAFYEFLQKVIFKEEGFKLNLTILNKLNDQQTNIVSYIYKTMQNFLITRYRELLRKYLTDDQNTNRYLAYTVKDETGKEIEYTTKHIHIDYSIEIEAEEIFQFLTSALSEKELRTLCYMFYKEKDYFDENLSDDAIYQRKSRLTKKLRILIKDKGFSIEGFSYFIEHLLSKICKKFR